MAEIGHGDCQTSDADAALQAAAQATPVLPKLEPAFETERTFEFELGESVSVTPVDYGCVPVTGTLVGHSHEEVIIERSSAETGSVFNHFPQAGFEVQSA